MAEAISPRRGDDVIPVQHEGAERFASLIVTIVPLIALGAAVWMAWGGTLHWQDIVVFTVTYLLTGAGITVGFHRLFTHRSFKTTRPLRALFAILGSAAIEGPIIDWVATHRKHHQYSDSDGDPHSPHVGHGRGFKGALRGLFHAHLGWIFRGVDIANPERYAKDLLADPIISFVNRTFFLWVVVGLAFPFGLGVALTGSVVGGLTGLLWGGVVRIFFLHHATYAINSLCHFFGRRPFDTGDHSRNLAWLALPTLGEAWHNNHHAFPTSARHGLGRFQPDPSSWIISALERCRLATDVVRVPPARQAAKQATASAT